MHEFLLSIAPSIITRFFDRVPSYPISSPHHDILVKVVVIIVLRVNEWLLSILNRYKTYIFVFVFFCLIGGDRILYSDTPPDHSTENFRTDPPGSGQAHMSSVLFFAIKFTINHFQRSKQRQTSSNRWPPDDKNHRLTLIGRGVDGVKRYAKTRKTIANSCNIIVWVKILAVLLKDRFW